MNIEAKSAPIDTAWVRAARVLGLLMIWFGVMRFFPFSTDAMGRLLENYPWLPPRSWAAGISQGVGALEVAIGLLLLLARPGRWLQYAGLAAALFWASGLGLLLGTPAWIQQPPYGGFPVIGSGQTLLKHLGIAAIGLGVFASLAQWQRGRRAALAGLWLGQLLVLGWIGLMKFTAIEAQGVEDLMRTSPVFAWGYRYVGVQGASNVIGVIELGTAALIALWPWRPAIARWGLWAAVITYALTNSFLFTLPGWQSGYGFPFVGSTGQFLLKDLLLMTGALILLSGHGVSRAGSWPRIRAAPAP